MRRVFKKCALLLFQLTKRCDRCPLIFRTVIRRVIDFFLIPMHMERETPMRLYMVAFAKSVNNVFFQIGGKIDVFQGQTVGTALADCYMELENFCAELIFIQFFSSSREYTALDRHDFFFLKSVHPPDEFALESSIFLFNIEKSRFYTLDQEF